MVRYADTREDAVRLVAEALELSEEERATAEASPDPEVGCCWLVVLADGRRFVAYTSLHITPALRGEVEPLGRIEGAGHVD